VQHLLEEDKFDTFKMRWNHSKYNHIVPDIEYFTKNNSGIKLYKNYNIEAIENAIKELENSIDEKLIAAIEYSKDEIRFFFE